MSIREADVEFSSGGETCRAWLFSPDQAEEPRPCIVMAHGLGLTRRSGLRAFGEAYALAGFSVLIFDYRSFGDSDGLPRQVISFRRQLQDWAAALSFARELPEVDGSRLVTWGFSLGGGHAMASAARDGDVAAVIAVAPMFSGLSSTLAAMRWWSPVTILRIVGRGLRDLFAAILGRQPITVPLSAPQGEVGLLTSPDAYPGYRAIVPDGFDFATAARIALYFWSYAPGRSLRRFSGAVLVLPSSIDKICPPRPIVRRARGHENAEVVELGCDHMGIALDPHRAEVLDATLAFLRKHVPSSTPD